MDYDAAAIDFYDIAMHGYPLEGSVRKASFCAAPGEYTLHAIDKGNDGWWGGAFYSVMVAGEAVVREEMTSSRRQSTAFTVVRPLSAITAFSENQARQGGGGALFWKDKPPDINIKTTGDSNMALYGGFAATPARTLSARSPAYNATSGASMATNPITLELRDQ